MFDEPRLEDEECSQYFFYDKMTGPVYHPQADKLFLKRMSEKS